MLSAFLSGLQYIMASNGATFVADANNEVFRVWQKEKNTPLASELCSSMTGAAAATTAGVSFVGLFQPAKDAPSKSITRAQITIVASNRALGYRDPATGGDRIIRFDKLTRIVTSGNGKNAPCTVSVQSGDATTAIGRLEFESDNIQQLQYWLGGLTSILNAAGYTMRSEPYAQSGTLRSYAISNSATSAFAAMSPMPSMSPMSSPSGASTPFGWSSSPMSRSGQAGNGASTPSLASYATLTPSDVAAVDEFRLRGALVTAYTLKKGQLVHKRLIVWVGGNAEAGGDADHLYWGGATDPRALGLNPDDSGDDVLELAELTAVEAGKRTPVLLALPAESVAADRCISIRSDVLKLDLVADSPQGAKAIIQALTRQA